MVNSTLSGNSANQHGGGLFVVESNTNQLYNVTISANTADADGDNNGNGGGVRIQGGLSAANTIISDNEANLDPDCSGSLTSLGYNLVADVTGCIITGDITGNIINTDPFLGPLQNNGGTTLTHALLAGSPAIDTGNLGGCRDQNGDLLVTDQRGFSRPASGSALCDMGAYESSATGPPTPTAPPPPDATPTAIPEYDNWNYLPAILKP